MRSHWRYDFNPDEHEVRLVAIIQALDLLPQIDDRALTQVLRRHPKPPDGLYRKSDLIHGVRRFAEKYGWDRERLTEKIRMKPMRTHSGVAPVTVLTKPFPCPGKCVFCPDDVRMPKSYLHMEPGAQRAEQNRFDPYAQTAARLLAFTANGHRVDKVELIILGGTWSAYPESYQRWFIKRCLDAMNEMDPAATRPPPPDPTETEVSWADLEEAQRLNETAAARNVGLVVETRPDHVTEAEVIRMRRLGATKAQIGYQSLEDEVLKLNRRGHDVAATRTAMRRLRRAGFKVHAHWMPNLYGSDPQRERADFARIFDDPDFRPDELKIYPCSIIETAELMTIYREGRYRPYGEQELIDLLVDCMVQVPPYCRTTRVIRDIPSHDIVAGNKLSNLREFAEKEIERRGLRCQDIRAREIRLDAVGDLRRTELCFETSAGREHFLQYVSDEDRIIAFLRLTLPDADSFIEELGDAAIIREVHVYGTIVGFSAHDGPQHTGLGRALIDRAKEIAQADGRTRISVISAIGTRVYYRKQGFEDGTLYQHQKI